MGGLGRGGDSNGGERDLKDFSGRNQAMAQMEQSRREDRGRVRDDEQELVSDMHPSEMLERYAGRDVAQVYVYKIYIYIYIYSKRLRPIPPGLGSRIWNLGRCLLEPCWGLLGSKLGVVEV